LQREDLRDLCKQRKLPHSGNKPDLKKRLEENDAKQSGSTSVGTAADKANAYRNKLANEESLESVADLQGGQLESYARLRLQPPVSDLQVSSQHAGDEVAEGGLDEHQAEKERVSAKEKRQAAHQRMKGATKSKKKAGEDGEEDELGDFPEGNPFSLVAAERANQNHLREQLGLSANESVPDLSLSEEENKNTFSEVPAPKYSLFKPRDEDDEDDEDPDSDDDGPFDEPEYHQEMSSRLSEEERQARTAQNCDMLNFPINERYAIKNSPTGPPDVARLA
jgi:hypothetical protein